ncbi:exonuclease 3'-5' domain-containing protein 2 isoform X1 [Vespa velutina]|uniref:exonuclease 3'-5' domain-containing protein 2 isoform X1 n=2 Tax=Vespa velutina TaxID=202808 RepID=UPI001FB2B7A6|nr:exonuclease 3'-5' domain-containing protein 2 isoform X1 [Vespa velutina]
MLQIRKNMFLVCVTVGLVLLASKYRNNMLRGVKKIYSSIKRRSNKSNNNDKKEVKIELSQIILADSLEKSDYAIQRIYCNLSDGILGFDCEWVNEGPVSLLQLATHNGVCALFRINKIGFIPPRLQELLASKRILKVGVAPFEDGQKIIKDHGCAVLGTLDLRRLAECFQLPTPKSLAAMCLEYLGTKIEKLIEVRCGDWDADTLSDDQVAYAACDAMASILIYHQIMREAKEKLSLVEKFVIYLWKIWFKDDAMKFHGLPAGLIDMRFKGHKTNITSNNNNGINKYHKNIINNIVINEGLNINEHESNIPIRKKPLYHNCYLQAPDGDILCTCDRKKAEWYIKKNLADVVEEQPFTVRLKFEPSGRALGEVGQYYTQIKINQCVVCGASENFIRKNVVPREYRKYFPLVMKAHQSHDVLLLCPTCHENSKSHDLQLRRKLADMCNAPLAGPLTHTNWKKLHCAIKALRNEPMLPLQRQEELTNIILEYAGQQEITPNLLNSLDEELKSALSSSINQSKQQPHGLKVVQWFEEREGGLVELERIWREHFLTTMKPQHLPNLWSVRHNQERLTIRQTQNRIDPQDAKVAGLIY